ncbi:hypothetical protein PQR57_16395 [Paraburkholderia dipogonis]|uniref:Uncharacterized protein n=1 Tax=Paraburkholderia dipogonis TaxID=1211383 RepID=A0ABW9ARM0_9BURK
MIILLTRWHAYAANIAQPPCPKVSHQGNYHWFRKAEQKKAAGNAAAQNTHTALGALT